MSPLIVAVFLDSLHGCPCGVSRKADIFAHYRGSVGHQAIAELACGQIVEVAEQLSSESKHSHPIQTSLADFPRREKLLSKASVETMIAEESNYWTAPSRQQTLTI